MTTTRSVLHTTYRLLRKAKACKDRYTVFRKAATALGYKGDTTPIPLVVALETNGLEDTLWALQAVLPGEKALRDKLARLFTCDCAEHTLPIRIKEYPQDMRPQTAIEIARRFAHGKATEGELEAARDDAVAASAAAWDAAMAAAREDAGAAWAATWAATWAAAREDAGATRAATWAATWVAAGAASKAAALQWQTERLHEYLTGGIY